MALAKPKALSSAKAQDISQVACRSLGSWELIEADAKYIQNWKFTKTGGGIVAEKDRSTSIHKSVRKGSVPKADKEAFIKRAVQAITSEVLTDGIRKATRVSLECAMSMDPYAEGTFQLEFPNDRTRQMEGIMLVSRLDPDDSSKVKIIIAHYSESTTLSSDLEWLRQHHDKDMISRYVAYQMCKSLAEESCQMRLPDF